MIDETKDNLSAETIICSNKWPSFKDKKTLMEKVQKLFIPIILPKMIIS